ncbi:MAG: SRPBCC family protein, partial [Acidimicrobiia bacterium]
PWTGRFEEIDEPERLVFAVIDAPELGDAFEMMTMTLTEKGGGTELVLRQSGGHLTDEQYEQAKHGTGGFLDALANVVAGLEK